MAAINVDKMGFKELVALEAKLRSAIAEARARGRKDIKKKVAALAATHGYSISELFGGSRTRKKSVGVAKYANPENKSNTWTGRGRNPNWLVDRLKKGAKLSDFDV
jgi:DNA-binding protein H-NS